jgi:putative membrane protein
LAIFASVFIWSAIEPKETFTWFLEVVPAVIGLVILIVTRHSFKLTPLLYTLILVHCVILMVGGHYTYAEVPFFDTLKEWFSWQRNNYDKVGHLAQGFIPAIIAREIFIRKDIINLAIKHGKGWMNFLIVSVCLAFSAFYELIEWAVAATYGAKGDSFLGTQGYVWDTQSDMGFALLGSILALIMLAKYHDSQLEKIN